jgi:TctA family transporter
MIPLLCMGIPGNTVSAIFLGGLQVHAISPGPLIFNKSGQYVYGIYLALIISSVFMLIFERLGLPVFVKLLDIPKHILLPCIVEIVEEVLAVEFHKCQQARQQQAQNHLRLIFHPIAATTILVTG